MLVSSFAKTATLHEHAAIRLAEAQHAPGVKVKMNPRTFQVEYRTADGELVPGYEYFLKCERNSADKK